MCGSLRLENQTITRNDIVPGTNSRWLGHARADGSRDSTKSMKDQWPSSKWRIKLIEADSFTERDSTGKVRIIPTNQIATLVNKEEKDLRIITRAARTPEEKAIHHRQPVNMSNKWTDKSFTDFLNNKLGTDYKVLE